MNPPDPKDTPVQAVHPKDLPAEASRYGEHVMFFDEQMNQQKRRLRLAPSFDRLVETNLELATSVARLVRSVHLTLGAVAVVLAVVLALAIAGR